LEVFGLGIALPSFLTCQHGVLAKIYLKRRILAIVGVTHDNDSRVVQRLSVSTKVSIGLPPNGDRNHPRMPGYSRRPESEVARADFAVRVFSVAVIATVPYSIARQPTDRNSGVLFFPLSLSSCACSGGERNSPRLIPPYWHEPSTERGHCTLFTSRLGSFSPIRRLTDTALARRCIR
jgi:hypothetical protein